MVHAYLMYGYPTQTIQETVDSLEMVRQLFQIGTIQSGFWHQFAMTAHSPVGLNPDEFGVIPQQNEITFANNDIQFKDKTGINHDKFSFGLKKSLFNYMHGMCFDYDLQAWFDFKIPNTKIAPDFIENAIFETTDFSLKPAAKIIWIGNLPIVDYFTKSKKGHTWEMAKLSFHFKTETIEISLEKNQANWLVKTIKSLSNQSLLLKDIKIDFESQFEDFELFWFSKQISLLRNSGLLVL
jgi:hypothetical protein